MAAFEEHLAGVDVATLTVAPETTRVSWLTLHAWLTERGAARVVVLDPLRSRAFRTADLRGSKTDGSDAVALATLVRWMGRRCRIMPGTTTGRPRHAMSAAAWR